VLVTFKTSAYSDITMFGEPAVSLLKLMGQSGNVPGALLAADIPEALQTLHEGLTKLTNEEPGDAQKLNEGNSPDNEPPPVALPTRAGPLVSLLEAARDANENVQWDS